MTRRDKLTLAALCVGHFVNDSYSSIIFPLLPLLKNNLHLSSGQVFWLAPLYSVSSSLMQPVYGIISDRYARRSFAVFGPAITGLFISMIGLSPSYAGLVLLLVLGGIGIGSFHPQAAAMASAVSGGRKRIGLALFSATGTIGYSIGPIGIALFITLFGFGRTYYAAGIGLLTSCMLYAICPPLPSRDNERDASGTLRARPRLVEVLLPVWKPLLCLYMITVIRSGMQMITNNYLPFLLRERGYEVTGTGGGLTVFLLLGGIGGLAGGFLAERISGRAVTLYSGLFSGPLLAVAFLTTGPLSFILLGLGGFMLLSTMPVNVAMAQELAPEQTSTVSALMMGAAWGVGALSPALLDYLVPAFGFRNVMVLAAGATMLSTVFAYKLPREEHRVIAPIEAGMAAAAGD